MRVTANSFTDSFVSQLNTLASRQYRLQTEASTGQRVQNASDDPAAMQRVLNLQSDSETVAQYQRNITQLQGQATATYDVINALKTISDRASELATQADGTKSPEELHSYGTEVTQLIQQAVQLVNGKYQDNYLLSGTSTGQPPFVASYDASGLPTGVTYQGNTGVTQAEIADGTTASAQTLGANDSGSGPRGLISDSRVGADFFNHLISLQNNLNAGNASAVAATDVPNLAKDEDNLLYHVATNGAVQSRLDATATLAQSRATALGGLISNDANADLADTLVSLNQVQSAYQAALQTGAKIMDTSLLNYLPST